MKQLQKQGVCSVLYSFSRLNLYSQCPFRFHKKYIQEIEEPLTKPLALGKGVHKGIEEMLKNKIGLEEAVTLGFIEAEFHSEVTGEEMKKLIKNAPLNFGAEPEAELHFELPLSDSPSAPKIQGYIDVVLDDSFIDWKTNWRPYDIWENMQIPLYAWAMMQLKNVSTIRGELYFLRYKKHYEYNFSKNEAEIARIWAYDLAMEIEERIFLAELFPEETDRLFPAKPSSICKHCPINLECFAKFVEPKLTK